MRLHGNIPAELRRHFLEWWFEPQVAAVYRRLPDAHGVVLAVAQYRDDEAADAVHVGMWPVRADPAWPPDDDSVDDEWWFPYGPRWDDVTTEVWGRSHLDFHGDNHDLIVAFAACCRPGCNQDMSVAEAYTPYAIHWRNRDPAIEIVGTMHQPQWEVRKDPTAAADLRPRRRDPLPARADLDVEDLLAARDAPARLAEGVALARGLLAAYQRPLADEAATAAIHRELRGWLARNRPAGEGHE